MTTQSQEQSFDYKLPHDVDAEKIVLATCMIDRFKIAEAIDCGVRPETFYIENHKSIFRAILEFFEGGDEHVDELKVSWILEKHGTADDIGGFDGLLRILDGVERSSLPGVMMDKSYARRIVKLYEQRRLQRAYKEGVEASSDPASEPCETMQKIEIEAREIVKSGGAKSSFIDSDAMFSDCAERFNNRTENPNAAIAKVGTPIESLNEILPNLGLNPGELTILAARPSFGKTALAMNIAERAAADDGLPVAVFSLEMSASELSDRMACSRASIDLRAFKNNLLTKPDRDKMKRVIHELRGAPLAVFDEKTVNIANLCAKAREHAQKLEYRDQRLELVVVDYLQLVKPSDPKAIREQQVSEMSRSLKLLARELDCPVLVLSQLNRESERDKRKPRLSDLRESGAIEQDADIVLLLNKQDTSEQKRSIEEMQIIVAKNRNGPVAEVPATFIRSCTRFQDTRASKDERLVNF